MVGLLLLRWKMGWDGWLRYPVEIVRGRGLEWCGRIYLSGLFAFFFGLIDVAGSSSTVAHCGIRLPLLRARVCVYVLGVHNVACVFAKKLDTVLKRCRPKAAAAPSGSCFNPLRHPALWF